MRYCKDKEDGPYANLDYLHAFYPTKSEVSKEYATKARLEDAFNAIKIMREIIHGLQKQVDVLKTDPPPCKDRSICREQV